MLLRPINFIKSFIFLPSFASVFLIRKMLHFQSKNTRFSRIISRLINAHLARNYGIHISVLVKSIGSDFDLPHPTGIVIGDGSVIGHNVKILQNVTLGRRDLSKPGTPIIKNNVSIMAGAVLLGPITVGDNSIVGANAVVLCDVPPNTTVVGVPARPIIAKD